MSYSSPSPSPPGPPQSPEEPRASPAGSPDETLRTEIESGADQLLSSAVPNGLSDPFSSAQGGWIASSQPFDWYTGIPSSDDILRAFTGDEAVDFFTGIAAEGDNPNFYTGGQNVDPSSGVQNAESFTCGGGTANASLMLDFAISGNLVTNAASAATGDNTPIVDDPTPIPITVGTATALTVVPNSDTGGASAVGQGTHYITATLPDGTTIIIDLNPPPAAPETAQPIPVAPPTGISPSPPPTPSTPPSPSAPSVPPPTPPPAPPTPSSTAAAPPATAPAVPDWTTQTEWDFPRPDPRLIQPVTSVDTGNRPLNFLLNKMLLPWANALLFLENIPLATLIGVDDALKHSPFQSEYQVASDMMPLEGAMGLAMEIGPALDYAATSLSTNQGLRALVTAPAYSFMGAGGVGGGTTLGSLTAETKAAGNLTELSELSALGEFRGQRATIQDIQDLLQELKDADIQVISVKGVNEWAQTEREALRVYHEVNQDTGLFTEAGDAFHEAVRAASGGETGPDRIDFNFVNEIKTSAGHPGLRIFTKALKAGERHAVEGLYDGAVVTVYDVLNRVKYFVQRAP